MRIYNNNESIKIRIKLLKEIYEIERDVPTINIDSNILNFVNYLLMKKLFYSSFIFLKMGYGIYKSKFLFKLLNLIRR